MPKHLVVSSVWLRWIILRHNVNRLTKYTRAARVVVDREAARLPPRLDGGQPRSIHDVEWRVALARGASEHSTRHVAISLHMCPRSG
jgi:hypothetical protein